jgi:hypothetical protein
MVDARSGRTYNFAVPTPFSHLALAEAVLSGALLHPRYGELLTQERPAFLLGNTAPDFVTLSGLPRAASHFFDIPMDPRAPAHLRLLSEHPALADPRRLAPAQAAFLAGYLAHLWLDQAWIAEIFMPLFGPDVPRSTLMERLVDHNLLRAHLDVYDQLRLTPEVGAALRRARPQAWLPFARDEDLRQWRDHLANQLEPGARPNTIEVFAHRLGLSAEAFSARLNSPAEMDRAVFSQIPPRRLRAFFRMGQARTVDMVQGYLSSSFRHRPPPPRAGVPRDSAAARARFP